MPKCKSYNADILWIKTEAGKAHPLDARHEMRWVQMGEEWKLVKTYASHFGTCPQSQQWSRAKQS